MMVLFIYDSVNNISYFQTFYHTYLIEARAAKFVPLYHSFYVNVSSNKEFNLTTTSVTTGIYLLTYYFSSES